MTSEKFEKVLEHAFIALVAVASVAIDEWIGQQHGVWSLLKYVLLFFGALMAISLLTDFAEWIKWRSRGLKGVGEIKGDWKEGFAHYDKDTPLGAFMKIENKKEGFQVYGTPYTAQGDAAGFKGMGFPWSDDRIVYYFDGPLGHAPRSGVGYLQFFKGEGGKSPRFSGMFFDKYTHEVRIVTGERFSKADQREAGDGEKEKKSLILRWAKNSAGVHPRELEGAGVVDGCWVDRICDHTGEVVGGSAIRIERTSKGFEMHGWSYRPDGSVFGDFNATGIDFKAEIVYRFDGISGAPRRGIGFCRFNKDAGAASASTLDGYFVEEGEAAHRLFYVKGRRESEEGFNRDNGKPRVMDYLKSEKSVVAIASSPIPPPPAHHG